MYVNALSFDPQHRWSPVPGLNGAEWALEVFTVANGYGLDATRVRADGRLLVADGLQQLGGQRRFAGRVEARLDAGPDRITWQVTAEAPELVKGVKLLLRGLPEQLVAQGWWTPTTPAGHTLTPSADEPVLLCYPWESWQTPWVCAADGPGLVVSVRDEQVRAKRFYSYLPFWSDSPVSEIVCDAAATERASRFVAPPIMLSWPADQASVRAELLAHLSWLERVYGLRDWNARDDVPDWARELELVLTLHGQHWTGHVFNTFDQMRAVLREIVQDVPGDRILAYLPGWEGRYYWQYPRYEPGEDLGGPDGFARLVSTACELGVHLMPMLGANGTNIDQFPGWEQAAFRSRTNRRVALINEPDWDNDRAGEDEQVFLNPGEPRFRAHLVDQVEALVERFQIEGVFLDTSACWFDDPRYDVFDGYRSLVGELHRRVPGLLVCGEGWYDALLGLFPMNQTWLDLSRPPRFDELPMRYSRMLGHLNSGAFGSGSTGVHEGGVRPVAVPLRVPGYVPALSVVEGTFTKHRDEVREFCRALSGAHR